MECPVCDKRFSGVACSCGWQPAAAGSVPHPRASRPWKFCEWTTAHGTCGAPTGTLSANAIGGPLSPPRLCAWHRDRERMSLAELKMSERQVFDDWLMQFPAGTSYQPVPGIWDKDPETLWLVITGAIPFSAVEAQLSRRGVDVAKAALEVEA
jgi:hypothetical protein